MRFVLAAGPSRTVRYGAGTDSANIIIMTVYIIYKKEVSDNFAGKRGEPEQ
jgi:hypothetical protein